MGSPASALVTLAVGVAVVAVWGIGLLQGCCRRGGLLAAHLFGAIGGVIAAYVLAGRREPPPARLAAA